MNLWRDFRNMLGRAKRAVLGTNSTTSDEPQADAQLQATSEFWGERAAELVNGKRPTSWVELPLVNELYINPLVSGKNHVGWLEAVAVQYFPEPVELVLSLGCGGGGLERHGTQLNIAQRFAAIDVSSGAIELAKKLAAEENCLQRIDYRVADLNTLELPENTYDCVFAGQSVHHIAALEHYFDQVKKTLRPGGFFILNEFVGANQFQWTDLQMQYAQEMLETLPEQYRISIRGHGLKTRIGRSTIEEMNNSDPTEAIRSEDIIPELEKRFSIVEKRDFGGTVIQLVLEDIAGNFTDTPESRAILQSMFDREQELLRSGALQSDFTLIVAR